MNVLETIVNAHNGAAVQQLGSQIGLQPDQTAAALSALVDPANLVHPSAVADGSGILGHLLGSKDVSREVASRASAQTGLSADALKRLLPLAATLMMGAFSKQSGPSSSLTAGSGAPGSGIAAMLAPLLGQSSGGSMVDNVTSMLGQFMKRS